MKTEAEIIRNLLLFSKSLKEKKDLEVDNLKIKLQSKFNSNKYRELGIEVIKIK